MKKNIFTNNGNLKEIVKNRMFCVPAKPAFNLNQRERSANSYTFSTSISNDCQAFIPFKSVWICADDDMSLCFLWIRASFIQLFFWFSLSLFAWYHEQWKLCLSDDTVNSEYKFSKLNFFFNCIRTQWQFTWIIICDLDWMWRVQPEINHSFF